VAIKNLIPLFVRHAEKMALPCASASSLASRYSKLSPVQSHVWCLVSAMCISSSGRWFSAPGVRTTRPRLNLMGWSEGIAQRDTSFIFYLILAISLRACQNKCIVANIAKLKIVSY